MNWLVNTHTDINKIIYAGISGTIMGFTGVQYLEEKIENILYIFY